MSYDRWRKLLISKSYTGFVMIAQCVAAKKEKNFARADEIRAELLAKGITLIDTREGTKFEINK